MWGLKKKYPSAKATRIIRPTYALLYKRGPTVVPGFNLRPLDCDSDDNIN